MMKLNLDVCLRLPEEEYDSFLKLLDSGIGNNADSIRNSAGITLTDCMNDSMLGKYVPEYIPEGMKLQYAYIYYYLDNDTGNKLYTKGIDIAFEDRENPAVYYGITATWAKEYGRNGWAGTVISSDELSLDTIEKYMDEEEKMINLGVLMEDVHVIFSSRGLGSEDILKILFKNFSGKN